MSHRLDGVPLLQSNRGKHVSNLCHRQAFGELKVVFDKLAEGAEKDRFQELHDMPFGIYGQFYDRFGVQWIFKGYKIV